MNSPLLHSIIKLALLEDVGYADITSTLTIDPASYSTASYIAKQDLVLAGMPFVLEVFKCVDASVNCQVLRQEGELVPASATLATVQGKTTSLLAAERLSLNILQRCSGIATLTRQFVKEVQGLHVSITDTRKTAPCCRIFDKYAVKVGGGANHRFGLFDGILIKDNHIKASGGITNAVKLARQGHHLLKVEVEVSSLQQVKEALQAGADVIMLDNMDIDTIKEAVSLINKKALVEVSGGVTLQNVRQLALTGVDIISIGALTHSVKAVDISMKIQ